MDGIAWYATGVAKSQTRLSDFTFTFHFHALEKEMATHSSVLAWRVPGTGAWWAAVYGVTQSQTWLTWHSSSSYLLDISLWDLSENLNVNISKTTDLACEQQFANPYCMRIICPHSLPCEQQAVHQIGETSGHTPLMLGLSAWLVLANGKWVSMVHAMPKQNLYKPFHVCSNSLALFPSS